MMRTEGRLQTFLAKIAASAIEQGAELKFASEASSALGYSGTSGAHRVAWQRL